MHHSLSSAAYRHTSYISSRLVVRSPLLALVACLSVSACSDGGDTAESPSHPSHDGGKPTPGEDHPSQTDGGTDVPPNDDPPNEEESDAGGPAHEPGETDGPDEPDEPGNGGDPDEPNEDPEPETLRSHFFLPTPEIDNTGAPRIALDEAGGMHAAYPTYVGEGAYYAYCDADCSSESDVEVVRFETELNVSNAMVALTPEGHPRVLLNSWDRIYYAQCDEDCTEQSSWDIGAILKHDNQVEVSGEAFALDPDGNPYFVLHAYIELFGVGQSPPRTIVASCFDACTTADGWLAVEIADETWEGGALRFDQSGRAHLLASAVKYELGVPSDRVPVYAECDEKCGQEGAEWRSLSLQESAYEDREKAVSMRPAVSMELTADGKPRAVAMLAGEAEDERLVTYLECDDNCTESIESWTGTVVSNNPELAAGLDLALDAEDNPRLAYNLGYSIFLASCDTGACASAPSEWQIEPVELASEMEPDEIILWPNCNVDAWFLHSPNLAISSDGTAKVGYQAADFSGGGVSNPDPNQTPCLAGLDLTWTRMSTVR